uniref:AcidPPc domain-containing protein n=1 Tax=Strongyloides venezuelensis TaxID=75913 RepID=A0A0K0FUA6_STRVS
MHHKKKTLMVVEISIKNIIIDILLILTLTSVYWFFSLFVRPTRTGFFCNDQTIRYPYTEASYSVLFLFTVGTSATLIILSVTEVFWPWTRRTEGNLRYNKYTFHGAYIPNCLVNFYYYFGWYLVGITSNMVFMEITKLVIGRKRPFFMDVCKPSVGYTSCESKFDYITSYDCLGEDEELIKVVEMSFFSGHASYSFFVATFLCIYLQIRFLKQNNLKLFTYLMQFVLVSYASVISYSRVTEHWHHWSDVLTGMIVGSSFAYIIIFKVAEISSNDLKEENNRFQKSVTQPIGNYKSS